MGKLRKKQIILLVLQAVLLLLFAGAGYYLKMHPLIYSEDEKTGETVFEFKTSSIYRPYQPVEQEGSDLPAGTEPLISAAAEPAVEQTRFYTIKKASVFAFSGLKNEQELDGVLNALKNTGSTATFFVTAEEMEKYPEQIRSIRDAGHSLGISVVPGSRSSAQELLVMINNQKEEIRTKYSFNGEVFLHSSFGMASSALLQAAGQGGFQVLSETVEAVPEKVLRMRDADEILNAVFPETDGKLQRGEIVHFQMGLLQGSDTLLGELVEKVIRTRCIYSVMAADKVASEKATQYSYPVSKNAMLPGVADAIYPGHLAGLTEEEKYEVIRRGYYGIDWVSTPGFLPGFSMYEFNHLDKRGQIENDENYIFLTFDDWGTDENVNKILAVLKKYNAIGTFFVRTQYVPYNPNLLRAIAADGHTIGCHTHTHLGLSNEVSAKEFTELTANQVSALRNDLVLSYDTLQQVIGDMRDVYGKPSLSRLFRPPTLAVGRNGLETVFDCGFKYSISGFYSTSDYNATNASDLAAQILAHIHSGSVLVLHFSDNAVYTADALEIVLSKLEGTKYQFAGLNAVL